MAKPCTYHHQGTLAVRECANDTSTTTDLSIESLNHVVRTDFLPVFFREIHVGQCLSSSVQKPISSLVQLHHLTLKIIVHHLFNNIVITDHNIPSMSIQFLMPIIIKNIYSLIIGIYFNQIIE